MLAVTRGPARDRDHKAWKRLTWPERTPRHVWGSWRMFTLPTMSRWCVWVDAEQEVIACSDDTWATIALDRMAQQRFVDDMTDPEVTSGFRWISVSVPEYGQAARREAAPILARSIGSADIVEVLRSELDAIVGEMRDPVARGRRLDDLESRLALLRSDVVAAQSRLDTLRARMDLAPRKP